MDTKDAALWEALRIEAGVRTSPQGTPQAKAAPRAKKPPRTVPPLPEPVQGPRVLSWGETPLFDPGKVEVVAWVQRGWRLTDLLLGATVYQVEGERWVLVSNPVTWWGHRPFLAYPLPASWGEDPRLAALAFLESQRS